MTRRTWVLVPALVVAVIVVGFASRSASVAEVIPGAAGTYDELSPQLLSVRLAAAHAPAIEHLEATRGAELPEPPPPPAPEPPRRTRGAGPVNITRLEIPRFGVSSPIEGLGTNAAGYLDTPVDGVYGVGWFWDYAEPGEGDNAVFTAHETWNRQRGPFYWVRSMVVGDVVTLSMADGRELEYEVISNVRYDASTIPMADILWPSDRPAGEEWITLITCGGRLVYNSTGYGDYLDRDVVVARLVE
jgi:hypothetical protein